MDEFKIVITWEHPLIISKNNKPINKLVPVKSKKLAKKNCFA